MIKKFYALVCCFMLPMMAYSYSCPCPNQFNLFKIGDSLDEILKLCSGCAHLPPKTYKQEPSVPQKWTYHITAPANPAGSVQGSVELTITFDETEKVTNITVNAQSLVSTNCGTTSTISFDVNTPNTIQVGNTMKTVKATCGKPQFIEKGQPQANNQDTPTITEVQYAGPPPVTLIFENGKLTEMQK